MVSRRKGRILAFQALYFWEANKVPVDELTQFAWLDEKKLESLDEGIAVFTKILIAGTIENIKEIDEIIKKHLENWDIKRVARVDLAVLRMSVFALKFQNEIPATIVIDEAIGICREYGTDESFKFINGVLDSIRKTLRTETPQEKKS